MTFGYRYPLKFAFVLKSVPERLRLLVENDAGHFYYEAISLDLFNLPSDEGDSLGNPETKTPRGTAVTRPIGRGTLGGMCAGGRLPGRGRLGVVRR